MTDNDWTAFILLVWTMLLFVWTLQVWRSSRVLSRREQAFNFWYRLMAKHHERK